MLSTSQQRRHAELLRERDPSPTAQCVAAEIDARAELEDAEVGRQAKIAKSAKMTEEYPILGHITREGGIITQIEHPWRDEDNRRIESQGVKISYQWGNDPMSGLDQGQLIRIWIGTRTEGPRVQWDHGRGWILLRSHGNYGKNWSHGGNWSTRDMTRYDTLFEAAQSLEKIIISG